MTVFAGRTEVEPIPIARLREQPPSAKLVFKVLELEPGLTQGDIAERTRLSARTTRHALSLLTDADLVVKEVYVPDARKRVYTPRPLEASE